LDVLGLAVEVALRDEQREVSVLRAGRPDAGVHLLLDAFPQRPPVRPDHHRAAHRTVVGQLGLGDDVLVPAREVLALWGEHWGTSHAEDATEASSATAHGQLTTCPRRIVRRGWPRVARSTRGSSAYTTRSAGAPSVRPGQP